MFALFSGCLLLISCVGILLFAETISTHRDYSMQMHVDKVSMVAFDAASIRLRLTDSEDLPIDQVSILSHASMPAMRMASQQIIIESLGQGIYLTHVNFSMVGAWRIDIIAHADGFTPVHQSLMLTRTT